MLQKPRLQSHLYLEIAQDIDAAIIISETNFSFYQGAIYQKVLPLLNGQFTIQEITRQLQDSFAPLSIQGLFCSRISRQFHHSGKQILLG